MARLREGAGDAGGNESDIDINGDDLDGDPTGIEGRVEHLGSDFPNVSASDEHSTQNDNKESQESASEQLIRESSMGAALSKEDAADEFEAAAREFLSPSANKSVRFVDHVTAEELAAMLNAARSSKQAIQPEERGGSGKTKRLSQPQVGSEGSGRIRRPSFVSHNQDVQRHRASGQDIYEFIESPQKPPRSAQISRLSSGKKKSLEESPSRFSKRKHDELPTRERRRQGTDTAVQSSSQNDSPAPSRTVERVTRVSAALGRPSGATPIPEPAPSRSTRSSRTGHQPELSPKDWSRVPERAVKKRKIEAEQAPDNANLEKTPAKPASEGSALPHSRARVTRAGTKNAIAASARTARSLDPSALRPIEEKASQLAEEDGLRAVNDEEPGDENSQRHSDEDHAGVQGGRSNDEDVDGSSPAVVSDARKSRQSPKVVIPVVRPSKKFKSKMAPEPELRQLAEPEHTSKRSRGRPRRNPTAKGSADKLERTKSTPLATQTAKEFAPASPGTDKADHAPSASKADEPAAEEYKETNTQPPDEDSADSEAIDYSNDMRFYGQKAKLMQVFASLQRVGLQKSKGRETRYSLRARTKTIKKFNKLCSKVRNAYKTLGKKQGEDLETTTDTLEELLCDLRDRATTLDPESTDEDEHDFVYDIYAVALPTLTRVLKSAVLYYEPPDSEVEALDWHSLCVLVQLIGIIVDLGERARRWKTKPPSDSGPIIRPVDNGITATLKQVQATLVMEKDDQRAEQEAREQARIRAEQYQARREREQARQAMEQKKKEENNRKLLLYVVRMSVEPDVSRHHHLRNPDIDPLHDRSRSRSLELDANGEPFDRLQLLGSRQSAVKASQDPTQDVSPLDMEEDQLYALLEGLRKYAGPSVFENIFRNYCDPRNPHGAPLRPYNVREIIRMAAHIKRLYLQNEGEDKPPVEDWIRAIPELDV